MEQVAQASGAELSRSFLAEGRPTPVSARRLQLADRQVRAVAEQEMILVRLHPEPHLK
jgi:hypothetical protein